MRLSYPQASVVGAQLPAANRLYELTVGAKKIASSRAHAIWPARNCPKTVSSSPKTFFPSRHRLEWMWQDEPTVGVVGLRHEGDRAALLVRDLLGAVLVDDVVVGRAQGVREAEVDLVLPRPRLALRALDPHAGALHLRPDPPQQRLVVGRGEDVVVEDVRHGRRQVAVVLRVRLLVALAEEEELELGADHRREAQPLRPLDLPPEHLPRRGRDGGAAVPEHVAEDEHRPLEPGDAAERGEIRLEAEVAVAALPARDLVAGHGVHLHLEREQVVAALDRVAGVQLVEEELGVEALAHQAALHVREGRDDGVDDAELDVLPAAARA